MADFDLESEIDAYRLAFLVHIPGLSWRDPDVMPHSLWLACREYVDKVEGR